VLIKKNGERAALPGLLVAILIITIIGIGTVLMATDP